MSVEDPSDSLSSDDRRQLQFSLRAVFWLTAVVAVAAALLFVIPDEFAIPVIMVLTIVLPALLATALVYGDSWQRTFCLGAMFPIGIIFLCTLDAVRYYSDVKFESWTEFYQTLTYRYSSYQVYAGISWVLAVATGLFTVALRLALVGEEKGDQVTSLQEPPGGQPAQRPNRG